MFYEKIHLQQKNFLLLAPKKYKTTLTPIVKRSLHYEVKFFVIITTCPSIQNENWFDEYGLVKNGLDVLVWFV